jgi:hypothetical protein
VSAPGSGQRPVPSKPRRPSELRPLSGVPPACARPDRPSAPPRRALAPRPPPSRPAVEPPPLRVTIVTLSQSAAAGGGPVSFSSTATCTAQPCTYVWAITCPATTFAAAQSVTLNGANVTVTVGPKGSQIDTWQLGGRLVCNVTLTGRGAQCGTAAFVLLPRPSLAGGAARAGRLTHERRPDGHGRERLGAFWLQGRFWGTNAWLPACVPAGGGGLCVVQLTVWQGQRRPGLWLFGFETDSLPPRPAAPGKPTLPRPRPLAHRGADSTNFADTATTTLTVGSGSGARTCLRPCARALWLVWPAACSTSSHALSPANVDVAGWRGLRGAPGVARLARDHPRQHGMLAADRTAPAPWRSSPARPAPFCVCLRAQVNPAPPVCGDEDPGAVPGQPVAYMRQASPSNVRARSIFDVCRSKKVGVGEGGIGGRAPTRGYAHAHTCWPAVPRPPSAGDGAALRRLGRLWVPGGLSLERLSTPAHARTLGRRCPRTTRQTPPRAGASLGQQQKGGHSVQSDRSCLPGPPGL